MGELSVHNLSNDSYYSRAIGQFSPKGGIASSLMSSGSQLGLRKDPEKEFF
jgi:hypothetical protein